MIRSFNAWNLGIGAVSVTLAYLIDGPLGWIPVAAQLGLIVGIVLGRHVVTRL